MEEIQENYSNEDMFEIIVLFGECNKKYRKTCRQFNLRYPNKKNLRYKTLKSLCDNLKNSGQFKVTKTRRNTVINEELEFEILLSVTENPNISIRQLSNLHQMSYSSIRKILLKNKYHPYKYELHQHLEVGDPERRIEFCEWFLVRAQENNEFLKNILWSDEANFTNNGVFNRHNHHYWATENQYLYKATNFQKSWKFNVWVGLINNSIVGPYFYDDNLNGDKYVNILRQMEHDFLDNLPLARRRQIFFHNDGAPPHNSAAVCQYLTNTYDDRWMGNNGPFKWPARSPDLNPLDFFLWGYIKNQIYSNEWENKEIMKNRVQEILQTIPEDMIFRSTQHLLQRVEACLNRNGGIFENSLQ